MLRFDLTGYENNIVTITVGKEYLYNVVDHYVVNNNEKEEIYKEISYFVNTIGNKDVIKNFRLPVELNDFLNDKERRLELGFKLYNINGEGVEFDHRALFFNMLRTYQGIHSKQLRDTIHLFIKLEPKEPDNYLNLDDTLVNYNSFIGKFYLKQYKKYVADDEPNTGWNHLLAVIYLLSISKLYELLQEHIENNIEKFLTVCLLHINPIITGLTVTTHHKLNTSAISIIHELLQLNSGGKQLTIKKNFVENTVEFCFHVLDGKFTHRLADTTLPKYRGDKTGKRLVKLLISGSGTTLKLSIDIVGVKVFHDITDYGINKTFFGLLDLEATYTWLTSQVFGVMLSHTKEHNVVLQDAYKISFENYKKGYYKTLYPDMSDGKDNIIPKRNEIVGSKVFKSSVPEKILYYRLVLEKNFNLNKYAEDYAIIATELFEKTDNYISNVLNQFKIASAQQALIRRMITVLRNAPKPVPRLNELYRLVSQMLCIY